jgi:hypothetical protein
MERRVNSRPSRNRFYRILDSTGIEYLVVRLLLQAQVAFRRSSDDNPSLVNNIGNYHFILEGVCSRRRSSYTISCLGEYCRKFKYSDMEIEPGAFLKTTKFQFPNSQNLNHWSAL